MLRGEVCNRSGLTGKWRHKIGGRLLHLKLSTCEGLWCGGATMHQDLARVFNIDVHRWQQLL